ncbi:hypothetical protein HHK36_009774 [Tetracentron sinense]|uniref:Adenylyl-sulfate kinase n=1 Tax=Tetracentron sinense TaxID=13715 RepID=A0A834ZCC2_TETSI|nr:hypothetical protein HHK36_009774 [Tetracentron sinense]
MIAAAARLLLGCSSSGLESAVSMSSPQKLGFLNLQESNVVGFEKRGTSLGLSVVNVRSKVLPPLEASKESKTVYINGKAESIGDFSDSSLDLDEDLSNDCAGKNGHMISTIGKSTNIMWHESSVGKLERQKLLQQKGCVIWITGLSGSGKSTVACALSRGLHYRGKLCYILDGDNVRHGLNRDLTFKAEDRAENIRRIGEVAKLFADAGVICVASVISPYRRDRDACRALLPEGNFVEVFMDIPLKVCEARDPKGLYKLARAGKIKGGITVSVLCLNKVLTWSLHSAGFTGIDDPYEPPLNSEIVLRQKGGVCASPSDMAEEVISYLEEVGYLQA